MEIQRDMHGIHYLLASKDVTICIKSDSDIQVENIYSNVFVFKKSRLKLIANCKARLQIWIIGNQSHELELEIPEFPFYKSCILQDRNYKSKCILKLEKISDLKKFIQTLFSENSSDYCCVLDGNYLCIRDKEDMVEINADDPVLLNRLLRIILNWAQFPITVVQLLLDQDGFRKSLMFWVKESMNNESVLTPIQRELMEIRIQENYEIDYFDQEFQDEFERIDSRRANSNHENLSFTAEFIQSCIHQIIYEYLMSVGTGIHDIQKITYLVDQVLKNPNQELIESIIFGATDFSAP